MGLFFNRPDAKEQIFKRIRNYFEESIIETIRDNSSQDPLLLGLMVEASIGCSCKSYKSSNELQILSGLSKSQYDEEIDNIAREMLKKYTE